MRLSRPALISAGLVGAGALAVAALGRRKPRFRTSLQRQFDDALRRTKSARAGRDVDDGRLTELVRAQISRPYVSQPGLIDAHVRRGRVVLIGVVHAQETDDLVSRIALVPGIRSIDSRLKVVTSPSLRDDPPRYATY